MEYDNSFNNPLVSSYNENKIRFQSITMNIKKSRKYLIISALACGILGGIYSAAFYMVYIKNYPVLFTALNYINFSLLFINALIGIITACKSTEKFALYYKQSTTTIFRLSILYQLVRIVIIFLGYFNTTSDKESYIFFVKMFALFALLLSFLIYYFVNMWTKFYYLIMKSYVTHFNKILKLEKILSITPSFLSKFECLKNENVQRDSYIPIKNNE